MRVFVCKGGMMAHRAEGVCSIGQCSVRGWMPDVDHVEAVGSYGYVAIEPGTMKPIAVLNHVMQGYQQTMITWAAEKTGRVSAHFTIGRDGRIVQHVGIFDPAWHAGRVEAPTWPHYQGTNPNFYTVGVEHEGFSAVPMYTYDDIYDEYNPWPTAMTDASIRVHQWIVEQTGIVPSVETIIGHNETATRSRADDPGEMWPRYRIIEALLEAAVAPVFNAAEVTWQMRSALKALDGAKVENEEIRKHITIALGDVETAEAAIRGAASGLGLSLED